MLNSCLRHTAEWLLDCDIDMEHAPAIWHWQNSFAAATYSTGSCLFSRGVFYLFRLLWNFFLFAPTRISSCSHLFFANSYSSSGKATAASTHKLLWRPPHNHHPTWKNWLFFLKRQHAARSREEHSLLLGRQSVPHGDSARETQCRR